MDRLKSAGILKLILQLVSCPSFCQTAGEARMARELYELLAASSYFRYHPSHLVLHPVPGDRWGRQVVMALVRGEGAKTVILLNHHDVVGISDYGPHRDLALDPLELAPRLETVQLTPQARNDLETGEWLWGRGTADMKGATAVQLALLAEAAAGDRKRGNLLFVSVPDEEGSSAGMRAAVPLLARLAREEGLEYVALINSEPHDLSPTGSHPLHLGTVGKLLLFFYCAGKEAHAAFPFAGLNPNLLAAELIRVLELDPTCCDVRQGCCTPPPVSLKLADTGEVYSVSTPPAVVVYFNLFTLRRTPAEVLNLMRERALKAFWAVLAKIRREAERYGELTGERVEVPWEPKVYTYRELKEVTLRHGGKEVEEHLEHFYSRLCREDVDEREFTSRLVAEVSRLCPDRAPKIVVCFAPPYYPHLENRGETPGERALLAVVDEIIRYGEEELGVKLHQEPYFMGISDLSYCGLQDEKAVSEYLQSNMPAWGERYSLPLAEMAELKVPVLNLGPWGRDLHQFTERLHLPYALDIFPRLLRFAVYCLLEGSG